MQHDEQSILQHEKQAKGPELNANVYKIYEKCCATNTDRTTNNIGCFLPLGI
jgi:hypothetical protein